ncbi:MAG: hypothetical protein JWM32_51, partial [Verrucomicrobia bacterium]|nr:hypothetical protein [Verrucomicrobiota bacterium]
GILFVCFVYFVVPPSDEDVSGARGPD